MLAPITPVPIQPRRCVEGETKGMSAAESVIVDCCGKDGIWEPANRQFEVPFTALSITLAESLEFAQSAYFSPTIS